MRAIYLALTTWAFAESIRLLVTVEYQVTRGDLGLATPFLFGSPRSKGYFYLFLGLALAAILAAWHIVHSRVGIYMRAIRDDEEAAAVMGVDPSSGSASRSRSRRSSRQRRAVSRPTTSDSSHRRR